MHAEDFVLQMMFYRKKAYTTKWNPIGINVSEHKKQAGFSAISISIAKLPCMEENRCCSGNCILKLVEKFNINKVASAVHLARSDVCHTNANHAHEELRELLKFGRCRDTAEVVTYFDHKNVLRMNRQESK